MTYIHKVNKINCLNCKHKLDRMASATTEEQPSPGDLTICIYCGHLMAYGEEGSLRNLTDDEMLEAADNPDIMKNKEVVRKYQEWKKSYAKSIQ